MDHGHGLSTIPYNDLNSRGLPPAPGRGAAWEDEDDGYNAGSRDEAVSLQDVVMTAIEGTIGERLLGVEMLAEQVEGRPCMRSLPENNCREQLHTFDSCVYGCSVPT